MLWSLCTYFILCHTHTNIVLHRLRTKIHLNFWEWEKRTKLSMNRTKTTSVERSTVLPPTPQQLVAFPPATPPSLAGGGCSGDVFDTKFSTLPSELSLSLRRQWEQHVTCCVTPVPLMRGGRRHRRMITDTSDSNSGWEAPPAGGHGDYPQLCEVGAGEKKGGS